MDSGQAEHLLLEVVNTYRLFRAVGQHQGRHTIAGTKVGVLQELKSDDLRLSDLAEHLGVSVSVTSRAVEALETEGLVERRSDKADGRAVLLSITDKGRVELAQRHDYVAQRFAGVLEGWQATDLQHTVDMLQRLNHRLGLLADVLEADGKG